MVVFPSAYNVPFLLSNGHICTAASYLWRYSPNLNFRRLRLTTDDNDFLDIDTAGNFPRIAILFHGLESHSRQSYMTSMAAKLLKAKWSVACVNFRGCSGEPNNLYASYHSGKTDDIAAVANYFAQQGAYASLALIGFSLGGNALLKYLGEERIVPNAIVCAAAVSVPCDLQAAAIKMSDPQNKLYMHRFARSIRNKVLEKKRRHRAQISEKTIRSMRTFWEIDEYYTAPAHGFASAEEYWRLSSSLQYISKIQTPTMLLSSLDDPFLAPECFPFAPANNNPNFLFEASAHGGHLGFPLDYSWEQFWHEKRILQFFENNCPQ